MPEWQPPTNQTVEIPHDISGPLTTPEGVVAPATTAPVPTSIPSTTTTTS